MFSVNVKSGLSRVHRKSNISYQDDVMSCRFFSVLQYYDWSAQPKMFIFNIIKIFIPEAQ